MSLSGLRVLLLESRRAKEMTALVERYQGIPLSAPSVRERALDANDEIFRWAERLFAGEFDMAVFLTGVGLAYLRDALAVRYPAARFSAALSQLTVVCRGPKPVAVLHELGIKARIQIPEPNTWKEIVPVLAQRPERRITIQEYGRPNTELVEALRGFGAEVTTVSVYRWEMPEDLGPLEEAARRIASGHVDLAVFTSSIQITHLLETARRLGFEAEVLAALRQNVAVASVGPMMDAALLEHGIAPDIAPEHPKMGFLMRAAADQAAAVLARKRAV